MDVQTRGRRVLIDMDTPVVSHWNEWVASRVPTNLRCSSIRRALGALNPSCRGAGGAEGRLQQGRDRRVLQGHLDAVLLGVLPAAVPVTPRPLPAAPAREHDQSNAPGRLAVVAIPPSVAAAAKGQVMHTMYRMCCDSRWSPPRHAGTGSSLASSGAAFVQYSCSTSS